ncbi:MAG: amidohydrolase family protein [Gemmatimonadota bacterium]
MIHRAFALLILLLAVPVGALGQATTTAPVDGMRQNTPGVHALVGARIFTAPGQVIPSGTLVIRDGLIEAVGTQLAVPPDAVVHDAAGLTLYAGFLDAYSDAGTRREMEAQNEADRGPSPWNPQLRAQRDAAQDLRLSDSDATALRSQGFTVVHAVPRLGLFRGSSAVVSLRDGANRDQLLRAQVAQAAQMERDVRVGSTYPTSAMGGVAFIRQTLLDAQWYGQAHAAWNDNPSGLSRPESNAALAALQGVVSGRTPLLFEAGSHEEVLRILRLQDEFGFSPWIRGSGHEYRLGEALNALEAPLVLPLAFPEAPGVATPEDALNATLESLRHWHLAPENPGRVAQAGVPFSLTADGLESPGEFLTHLRKAVSRGLPPETALAALTVRPAALLGLARSHGSLEVGKSANVVVASGDLFTEQGAEVREVWVDGHHFPVDPAPETDPRGRWTVTVRGGSMGVVQGTIVLEGSAASPSGRLEVEGTSAALSSISYHDGVRRLRGTFSGSSFGPDAPQGEIRFTASVSGQSLTGWVDLPDGSRMTLSGNRAATSGSQGVGGAPAPVGDAGDGGLSSGANGASSGLELPLRFPSSEYGRIQVPAQADVVLVQNATIWTMGPDGKLEGADLLVRQGRVVQVGQGLSAPAGAVVVDGTGKHVTPGLIDPHIHSGAAGGINETGAAIVPEVRLGDVLVTENIWAYRQLAGGLTTAHVMHGSANPIGGQNQAVKMRWGHPAESLKFEGAPRTVKFALGENPVRREDRYPDTRMGTHQIIRDHFKAAREYREAWRRWDNDPQKIPPRRDLRLEAIAEILEGEILVQSHGYRQDEFLMLVRLAEEFDFSIKAIHHGVEAYKIAPELAASGVAAVVWSDWGGFKVEAYDATTYNARILHEAGVLTSLHSDNSQIASRMNWEAAKMLRTGMEEEDALALVTINAATVLGLEERVGSLEAGKDADFVVWSGHPLSAATRAEQTWVDGTRYFDIQEDQALRRETESERAQIIQAILNGR